MGEDILKQCYEKAKDCIRKCSTENGLYASCGKKGYNAVWARDSIISMIGASLVDDAGFKEVFRQSLITLASNQGKTGQIPNCVDKWSERNPHVDFQTIDSSLWYLIGHYVYKEKYGDDLFNEYKDSIDKALGWLRCQDSGENGMLTQLPTSDWQDAFPHRYGYTINTQALYYKVLNLIWETDDAVKLKEKVNKDKNSGLWNGNFYVPYRWKNHGKYMEIGNWFDSLGNLLAVVFELADSTNAKKILAYIKAKKIDNPYPVKAIFPVIKPGTKYWQDYYKDCLAGKPNSYLNGGIWGYVGCFYALALMKIGKLKEAGEALEKIAELNIKNNFPEWTHPVTKKSFGGFQAWEAGMYILAYGSLDEGKVLI